MGKGEFHLMGGGGSSILELIFEGLKIKFDF